MDLRADKLISKRNLKLLVLLGITLDYSNGVFIRKQRIPAKIMDVNGRVSFKVKDSWVDEMYKDSEQLNRSLLDNVGLLLECTNEVCNIKI